MSKSKMLQETFSKNIVMVKRMEKVCPINIVVDIITCASIFKINNSFAIKNDEISHSENFNHASHLNFGHPLKVCLGCNPQSMEGISIKHDKDHFRSILQRCVKNKVTCEMAGNRT